MTDDERRLLLCVARQMADTLEDLASQHGRTDNLVSEMRRLIEAIRPKS